MYSKTSLARPSLARQTCLSPWQYLGRISSHAFSLDKPPPSPLALATTLKHLTMCNLTLTTRHWQLLNASQHAQRWLCMDAASRRSLSHSAEVVGDAVDDSAHLSLTSGQLALTRPLNGISITPSCHCHWDAISCLVHTHSVDRFTLSLWPTQERAARRLGRRRVIN